MADLSIKPDEIDWRVGNTFDRNGAKWGMLLGYIDSRLAMEKLDLLDPQWSSRMEPVTLGAESGVRCTLTVNGVSREDVGTASNTEPLKGAFSDALKRAAVHFGIGRELYDLPHIAVECNVGANGKVKSPKALPSWNGTRWTIDGNLGWVKYDQEPPARPARPVPPAATARARLASVASEHGVTAADLERIAKEVGADKPATDAQIEQIIALIESPGLSTSEAPAPEQRDSADSLGNAAGAVTPVGPASGNGPQSPEVPVAADSEAGPSLEDIVQATGGELLPPKPGTDEYKALPTGTDRANAKAYWDKAEPKGARETHEPEEVSVGL